MKIAVDTSILIGILQGHAAFNGWRELFINRKKNNDVLIICDVVFAEISHLYKDQKTVTGDMADLGVIYDEIKPDAAYAAGSMYRAYRSNSGCKKRVLPDFLVGAHATHQADALASTDCGFLKSYFVNLQKIHP